MKEIFSRTVDDTEIACRWTLSRNFLEKVRTRAVIMKRGYITDISLSNIETLLLAAEEVNNDEK